MVPLPDRVRHLLDVPNLVVVGTVSPDGAPHTSLLWATYEGDELLLSTIEGRQKPKNWALDPRVSVLILDEDDSDRYVEVRGTVTMTREGGPELIDRLSLAYEGKHYEGDLGTDNVRLVVRVTPTKVHVR
jgi:PPOX class probable F420-dependent enzyme